MRRRDLVDLLVLATLWSASFLFMRIAAPAFGPLAMVEVRVAVASLTLIGIVLHRQEARALAANWPHLLFVGAVNSAIPFSLFGFALLSLSAGFGAILNATAPLFGAMIVFAWLHERLPPLRIAGLVVGFSGVALLVWGKPSFQAGGDAWAVVAALVASLSYGVAPSYIKRNLAGAPPLIIATGSQIGAALLVLPLAIVAWPERLPGIDAWLAVIALGIACTGLAYILYFRLIANVGPSRAIAVTFLIPAFGMLWGALFLGETVTLGMIAGCLVILAGTALATGMLTLPGHGKPVPKA